MEPLPLLLVLHGHVPAGAPEEALARAWEAELRPTLEALEAAPALRVGLHLTGPLWEHLAQQPEALARVRALVERGQVEVLGGGFYAPLLAALPDWDARGQLARMQGFAAEQLGGAPRGALLPEGVWEPDLPRVLAPAGLRYLVLPGEAFAGAGLAGPRRFGYHAAERAGAALALFPADAGLGALLQAGNLDALVAELLSAAQAPSGRGGRGLCALLPVGRLPEGLASSLAAVAEEVEPTLPGAYLEGHPAQGRLALPGWAPPGHREAEARPEAQALRARQLRAARKLGEAEAELGAGAESLGGAREALHRGQAHLEAGQAELRRAAQAQLIAAENAVDAQLRGEGDFIEYEEDDLDADLRDEALLANAHLSALVDPDEGGTLSALDDRVGRRGLTPVAGGRPSFVDRFHPAGLGLEALGPSADVGDFARGAYVVEASGVDEEGDLSASITLAREGVVRTPAGERAVLVEKTYCLPIDAPRLEVEYILENQGEAPLALVFAPELSLDLPAGARENLGVRREVEAGAGVWVGLDAEAEVWRCPVEEGEGTCLVLRMEFTLPPGESKRVRIGVEVRGG